MDWASAYGPWLHLQDQLKEMEHLRLKIEHADVQTRAREYRRLRTLGKRTKGTPLRAHPRKSSSSPIDPILMVHIVAFGCDFVSISSRIVSTL